MSSKTLEYTRKTSNTLEYLLNPLESLPNIVFLPIMSVSGLWYDEWKGVVLSAIFRMQQPPGDLEKCLDPLQHPVDVSHLSHCHHVRLCAMSGDEMSLSTTELTNQVYNTSKLITE